MIRLRSKAAFPADCATNERKVEQWELVFLMSFIPSEISALDIISMMFKIIDDAQNIDDVQDVQNHR
ncbi:hypothetical protein HNY73_007085 [Argiope bruennichi]|uniref:Uncharacterized protein n=1 Tax=Argiope bruennichi TaxID=94029 RepID=A0A8T0FFB9_ARGBR|nr:hypothetical protein HNY73_007085 [Argiope bruennichi]